MATVYLDGNAVAIDGKTLDIKGFAFDGCHKIYLLAQKDIQEARYMSYDVYDIKDLQKAWDDSCGLRFISTWGHGSRTLIEQCSYQLNRSDIDTMSQADIDRLAENEGIDARALPIEVV